MSGLRVSQHPLQDFSKRQLYVRPHSRKSFKQELHLQDFSKGQLHVRVRSGVILLWHPPGTTRFAEKVGLTLPKVATVVDYLGLCSQTDEYKKCRMGSQTLKRYAPPVERIKETLNKERGPDLEQARRNGQGSRVVSAFAESPLQVCAGPARNPLLPGLDAVANCKLCGLQSARA